MNTLLGKVAAVTGGGAGIGEATARLLVARGACVAIADIDVRAGEALAGELAAEGGRVLFHHARVERETDCAAFISRTVETFGRIDVLVNNASARMYQGISDTTESSWDTMLGVNVKGYAFCAKAAIAQMRQTGGGSIVNVSSIRSILGGRNMVEYDTTKAAVLGLTRSLAYDHAEDGIRVNAVSPGPVFTQFHAHRAAARGLSAEAFKKEFGSGGMLRRPAEPGEIASCIAFLASGEASYVTGTNLVVDGGISAMDLTR